jgi:hypothetical protein
MLQVLGDEEGRKGGDGKEKKRLPSTGDGEPVIATTLPQSTHHTPLALSKFLISFQKSIQTVS